MARHRATQITFVIPGSPDHEPADRHVASFALTRLRARFGYVPPLTGTEAHGWAARWPGVDGAPAGWGYSVLVADHIGPDPARWTEADTGSPSSQSASTSGSEARRRRSASHPAGRRRAEKAPTLAPA